MENKEHLPLYNAYWEALHGPHREIAYITDLACAYRDQYYSFSAVKENTEKAYRELASIVKPGRRIAIRGTGEKVDYPEWDHLASPLGVRMVLDDPINVPDLPYVKLVESDIPEMIALSKLSSHVEDLNHSKIRIGDFYGIREDGRVVAMAGERVQLEGYSEVSGVVTHPDYRKRGYGGGLTLFKCNQVQERGKIPFLGVIEANDGAVRLYQKLGFKTLYTGHLDILLRTEVNVF